jgi:hypothetical protein
MTYLSPHQHELRHRLLHTDRAAAPPARCVPLEKRPRRRRLLHALRTRVA